MEPAYTAEYLAYTLEKLESVKAAIQRYKDGLVSLKATTYCVASDVACIVEATKEIREEL